MVNNKIVKLHNEDNEIEEVEIFSKRYYQIVATRNIDEVQCFLSDIETCIISLIPKNEDLTIFKSKFDRMAEKLEILKSIISWGR